LRFECRTLVLGLCVRPSATCKRRRSPILRYTVLHMAAEPKRREAGCVTARRRTGVKSCLTCIQQTSGGPLRKSGSLRIYSHRQHHLLEEILHASMIASTTICHLPVAYAASFYNARRLCPSTKDWCGRSPSFQPYETFIRSSIDDWDHSAARWLTRP
jgi:hypothetical protein